MADDVSPGSRPRYKTRSASISAPASTSMENVLMPTATGTSTPEGSGTPGYRRRKATRSQSARITGARSVSKVQIANIPQCCIIDTIELLSGGCILIESLGNDQECIVRHDGNWIRDTNGDNILLTNRRVSTRYRFKLPPENTKWILFTRRISFTWIATASLGQASQ